MGKYTSQVRKRTVSAAGPHPIWNSIGCVMMIVVPAISIAVAVWTINYGLRQGWPIPAEILRPIVLPKLIYRLPGLAAILEPIVSVDHLVAYALLSLFYILVLGGILAAIYAAIYRFTGPPKYGPLDAPPLPRKATRRSR
jgi:hypothetical protein